MSLVSLNAIAAEAEANGFRVRRFLLGRGGQQLEIIPPDYTGPEAYHYNGACYSTAAAFQISDRSFSYGYNDCFCGPWHDGFTQSDAYGVQKLYAHPAMQRHAEVAA